jgi:hypothetical protein
VLLWMAGGRADRQFGAIDVDAFEVFGEGGGTGGGARDEGASGQRGPNFVLF